MKDKVLVKEAFEALKWLLNNVPLEVSAMLADVTVPFQSIQLRGGQGTSWPKFYLRPPAMGQGHPNLAKVKFGQQICWVDSLAFVEVLQLEQSKSQLNILSCC